MELTDKVPKYKLTVEEIIGKLALEFIGQPQILLEYDIEKALGITPTECKELIKKYCEKYPIREDKG